MRGAASPTLTRSHPTSTLAPVYFTYGYDTVLPSPGADAEQVMNTVAGLERAGVRVDLLVPTIRDAPLAGEALKAHYQVTGRFTIDHIGPPVRGPRWLDKLVHALRVARDPRAAEADLVYTRHLPMVWAALRKGFPVLYDTYRPWPAQYPALKPWLRYLVRHPRFLGVLTHSQYAAESFLGLGLPQAQVRVMHNGFDPARMQPRLEVRQARRQLGFDESTPIVTYAGRVDPRKGIGLILSLARRCPTIRFHILGSRGSGPLEVEGASIPNVAFFPWLPYDEVVPHLYASDVLLIPPTLDPLTRHGTTVLPLKLYLYLAAGRVIVAPTAPDTRELLHHDDNALLVRPGDLVQCASTIMRAVQDRATQDRLGSGALATAADLTWDVRGQRIAAFARERLQAV